MTDLDLGCLVALARQQALDRRRTNALMRHLGGAIQLFGTTTPELEALGVSAEKAAQFVSACLGMSPERELELCAKHGIEILPVGHQKYPPQLAQLPDRPNALFVRGSTEPLLWPLTLAVVGTRAMTNYGRAAVSLLAGPLARAGFCLVSGLALGIDAAAHAAALEARGLTVAVLGSGVDRGSVGPKANLRLAEDIIAAGGALVSEYPPGFRGSKFTFPERNRIIAGLASGTLVVEAAEKSGALITVKAALEYGRDVFAVPGPVTQATSAGTNDLLKQGAIPVTSTQDIMFRYGIGQESKRAANIPLPDDPDQKSIIAVLRDEPVPLDILSLKSGLPLSRVAIAASALEMAGLIGQSNGDFFLKS
jgi:DNA processing protein